ncbi:MAG: response regulator transcription factor [Bacteroidia bacterium]
MNILIIDDQHKNLNFLRRGLEEEGHFIHTAEDGEEGLLRALTKNYDLILLNWILPVLSGVEVCRSIRSADKTTPILFQTTKETLEETILGLDSGANDYIKKPFSFAELQSRINVYIRNANTAEREYVLDDIHLNINTHRVFKGLREVNLTQKEFLLLSYLLRNKGQVCSRDDIIREVWGIHYDYNPGIIDVFMNGLRKKLNIKPQDQRLRTIRGIGFMASDT